MRSASSPSIDLIRPKGQPVQRECALTARALHLQHTFLSAVLLEGIRKRCRYREDSPLAIGWRAASTARWKRCFDDRLVTLAYGGTVGGCVQRGHSKMRDSGKWALSGSRQMR